MSERVRRRGEEMKVRDLEQEWLGTGRDVPPAVRAMWFLSSVIVLGKARGLHGKRLYKATSQTGTVDDVREALKVLAGLGETASVLLDDIPAPSPDEGVEG